MSNNLKNRAALIQYDFLAFRSTSRLQDVFLWYSIRGAGSSYAVIITSDNPRIDEPRFYSALTRFRYHIMVPLKSLWISGDTRAVITVPMDWSFKKGAPPTRAVCHDFLVVLSRVSHRCRRWAQWTMDYTVNHVLSHIVLSLPVTPIASLGLYKTRNSCFRKIIMQNCFRFALWCCKRKNTALCETLLPGLTVFIRIWNCFISQFCARKSEPEQNVNLYWSESCWKYKYI